MKSGMRHSSQIERGNRHGEDLRSLRCSHQNRDTELSVSQKCCSSLGSQLKELAESTAFLGDVDVRRCEYARAVAAGGTALFQGTCDEGLTALALFTMKIMVVSPPE